MHLYLSEMLIAAFEQMQWRSLFESQQSHPPSPPKSSGSCPELAASAEQNSSQPLETSPEVHQIGSSVFYTAADNLQEEHPEEMPVVKNLDDSSDNEYANSAEIVASSLLRHFASLRKPRSASDIQWLVSYAQAPQMSGSCPELAASPEQNSSQPLETAPERQVGSSVFYTAADNLQEEHPEEISDNEYANSAEIVASSLLRHFAALRKPRSASDIQWLVSYAQAPQMLLPMPDDIAVYFDELDRNGRPIFFRGSDDWAPPRKQWIFQLHPRCKSVPKLLEQQQYRCAGCGIKVGKIYTRRMRYCDYYGKMFCQRWNIRLYGIFSTVPNYMLTDADVYSMADLEDVQKGELFKIIAPIVKYGRYHVESCEHCSAQAFVCELCDERDDLLFPFQLERVERCDECGSLSHRKCAAKRRNNGKPCPKCMRIQQNLLVLIFLFWQLTKNSVGT
ncbi:unnamed protein product [Gongylonema pulchrum]|uniref:DUF4206 domain-containing protein n=1 Tax=Gongylonema pulchrum TaxID=637853 RepID=A0A183DZP2_9BILA|nr:unnamed protein product [Gongylonema pulchrum]